MNKKHYFLFIVKNISCVQFLSCHTSDEKILMLNFSQTTVNQERVTAAQACLIKCIHKSHDIWIYHHEHFSFISFGEAI